MSQKGLYIWVEGPTDNKFFEKIIKPYFQERYDFVKIGEWSQTKPSIVCKMIKSNCKHGQDYIFVTDFDGFRCVKQKKDKITQKYPLNVNKVVIVKTEIESWYLAGLNKTTCKFFKIKTMKDTQLLKKDHFMKLIPKGYDEKMFKIEILENYSLKIAKQQNESFNYFVTKYNIGCEL